MNVTSFQLSAEALGSIRVFAELDRQIRGDIAGKCRGGIFDTGGEILSQESSSREVYFIIDGTVRVTYFSAGGKEVSFRDMHSGDMFGELSAIDGLARSARVVAREPSRVAWLPPDEFHDIRTQHPAIAEAVLVHLTGLVRSLSERVIEYSALDVRCRIQAELLRLSSTHPEQSGAMIIERLPKHADIAARVATHREAVTRELNRLASVGLITKTQKQIVINDEIAFRAMVKGGSYG